MKNEKNTFYEFLKSVFYIVFLGALVYILCSYGYENLNIKQTILAVERIKDNMHDIYVEKSEYPKADVLKNENIAPKEMNVQNGKEYFWKHYFGGNMLISGVKNKQEPKFNIVFNNLSKRHCKILANRDWRDNKYFVGIMANGYGVIAKDAGRDFSDLQKLIPEAEAEKLCDCGDNKVCSVVLVYK